MSADDLGLTKSVNEGIVRAHKEGIVTSFNLVPSGEAFEDAVGLLKSIKIEEAGAHLALTETASLSDPAGISTLIAKDGRFPAGRNDFFIKLFRRQVDLDQIYAELNSQLDRVEKTGIRVTNLSGHEHIHMLPQLLSIFVRLAKEHKIPSIRCLRQEKLIPPLSLKKIYKSLVVMFFEKEMRRMMDDSVVLYTDNFAGFLDSGSLKEDILVEMLKSLKEGVTELVCHPGFLGPEVVDRYRFHLDCEQELFSLTSPRVIKAVKDNKIQLISYRDFLKMK